MARGLAVIVLAGAALLLGCESDLPQATEIEHMRVLGARFDVVGDEARSTPKPGETLRVSMPVVFPSAAESTADVETLLIGCTGPDRYTGGLPLCQEFVDAALSGQSVTSGLPLDSLNCDMIDNIPESLRKNGALSIQCVRGEPSVDLEVPEDFSAEQLLFLGVVCERGQARIDANDPLLFGCDDDDGGEVIRVHGLANVELEADDENFNPSLAQGLELSRDEPFQITREGVPWLPYDYEEPPPERGCQTFRPFRDEEIENARDENLQKAAEMDRAKRWHSVVAGAHKIVLRYEADAREKFEGAPENLEFTVYTTVGEMERRFTLFAGEDEGEDGVLQGELDWEPPNPSDVPAGGELVRFFITLRDQRGGFAMTERVLCLR
jgi:hypothetical protein